MTERERTVLALMAGRPLEPGDRGSVIDRTQDGVEAHIANIFSKLELLPTSDEHRRVPEVLAHLQGSGRSTA